MDAARQSPVNASDSRRSACEKETAIRRPDSIEASVEPGHLNSSLFPVALMIAAALGLVESSLLAAASGPSPWEAICLAGLSGFVPAQGGLVAIWSALGSGRHAQRIGAAAITALVWLVCFALGISAAVDGRFLLVAANLFIFFPLVFLAVQAPLWPFRILLGWRVERVGRSDAAPPERPLSLGQMMLTTAALAASLALLRCVSPERDAAMWLLAVCFSALMAAGICTLTVLPTTLFVLGARKAWHGLLATLLYVAGWIAIAVAVAAAIARFQGNALAMPPLSLETALSLVFGFGYFGGLSGALLLLRFGGFRLRRSKRASRRRAAGTDGPTPA